MAATPAFDPDFTRIDLNQTHWQGSSGTLVSDEELICASGALFQQIVDTSGFLRSDIGTVADFDYGEIYSLGTAEIPNLSINTYFNVQGLTQLGKSQNFDMPGSGQLRYVGQQPKNFLFIASLSTSASNNNRSSEWAFAKNNTIIQSTHRPKRFDGGNNEARTHSLLSIIPLSSGNFVNLIVQTTNNTVTYTSNYTITGQSLFGSQGPRGDTGPSGDPGGPIGPTGPVGPPGQDGIGAKSGVFSAYELGTTLLSSVNFTNIGINTANIVDPVFSFVIGSGVIVNQSGLYKISGGLTTTKSSGGQRADSEMQISINNFPLNGTLGSIYNRNTSQGRGSAFITTFTQLNSGDKISLQGLHRSGAGNVTSVSKGSSLTVEHKR